MRTRTPRTVPIQRATEMRRKRKTKMMTNNIVNFARGRRGPQKTPTTPPTKRRRRASVAAAEAERASRTSKIPGDNDDDEDNNTIDLARDNLHDGLFELQNMEAFTNKEEDVVLPPSKDDDDNGDDANPADITGKV